jgi:pyridoxamine 5'-phosphate oxidase
VTAKASVVKPANGGLELRQRRKLLDQDPISAFRHLFRRAERAGVPQPDAMVLATAGPRARVSARFVLLKQLDDRGFVFYTDTRSRKGNDLKRNPSAAAVFYWYPLRVQVRIEGQVGGGGGAEADQYWSSRPRESQLGATVSKQSARLASRKTLLAEFAAIQRRLKGKTVPRPSYWTGFRIVPELIEFWTARQHRLHHRELFIRSRGKWHKRLLYP